MISYLASWFSGSASSRNSEREGTVCVACDARKHGVSRSLMSPLSLRGDSHPQNLTGCLEAREREGKKEKRAGKVSKKEGWLGKKKIQSITKWRLKKEKKRNFLSLSIPLLL